MTLDEAVARVTRQLDDYLLTLLDASFERMIAAGVSFDEAEDIANQQARETTAWRAETLVEVRRLIDAEIRTSRP